MKRIRKYLIHLLGGVTGEYCDRKIDYFTRVERVNALSSVLLMMERCYGQSAEEWCNNVYTNTLERYERAEKYLNDLRLSIISKNSL